MTRSRTYGDRCGIARALDIVGDRWGLLIVRELLLGPKRFTDLRTGLPNVGPDVLAQRLRDLEAAGVIERRTLDPPAASRVYELTERGAALEPVVLELGRWGSRAPVADPRAPLGPDAFVLALKTMWTGAGERDGIEGELALGIGGIAFAVSLHAGEMSARRGETRSATATITGEPGELARLIWHGGGADAVLSSSDVRCEGDRRLARRFLKAVASDLG